MPGREGRFATVPTRSPVCNNPRMPTRLSKSLRAAAALLLLALSAAGAASMAEVEAALARGDYNEAVPRLEALAAQGNPAAQFRLGSLHSLGQGMPVDHRQAAVWFEKASAGGHHEATVTLANMHLSGLGVPRDETRALELFERAAEIAARQEIEEEEC